MSHLSLRAPLSGASFAPSSSQRGLGKRAFQQDWLAIGLLALLAYGLNVCYLPLFSGVVQMLFGSVAVLMALELFGLGAGIMVALVASLHTYVLWGHPYSIGVLVLEPIVVYGLRRRTHNLVFADAAFWFLVGMPLTWLIYRYLLHFTPDETLLVTFKNGVNGLLTALIASLVLLLAPLRRSIVQRTLNLPAYKGVEHEAERVGLAPTGATHNLNEPSFALLLFNLLVGAAIIPALGLTLRHSWIEMTAAEQASRASVLTSSDVMNNTLHNWAKDNRAALSALAQSVATNQSAQVQRDALLLHDLHPDFAGFVLVNSSTPKAVPQVLLGAETPLFQPDGTSGRVAIVDRSLARHDDLFLAARQAVDTTQSLETLEVRDAGNDVVPVWAIKAEVPGNASDGTSTGQYLVGLLRLEALQSSLSNVPSPPDVRVLVLDGSNRTLAAVPSDVAPVGQVFDGFNAEQGRIDSFEDGARRWWPNQPKRPPLQAWAASVFYAQRDSNTQTPWRIIVEAPFRPQEERLVHGFTLNLGWILILTLGAMPLAMLLSRRLNRPLEQLAALSTNLPRKLAAQDTTPPDWPHGGMAEVSHLVRNVQQMEGALRANFNALDRARHEAVTLQREAEEANRLKDEFLAVLSHELRTPLVPIIGYADLLQMSLSMGTVEPEMVGEAARIIERNARAQGALIEDLLDVSRIVAGKMTLKVGMVNLKLLLEESLETVSFKAQDRRIQLHLTACDDMPPMIGDSARLQQVVQNLLNNALKFSPEGGRVTVRLERETDKVRVIVADEGRGIAPALLPFIFDRFRQVHKDHQTRDVGGLGLGLAIVKHLTELHGGTIEAHSGGEGQGSEFIMCLPFNFSDTNGHATQYDNSSAPLEGFTAEDIAAQLF